MGIIITGAIIRWILDRTMIDFGAREILMALIEVNVGLCHESYCECLPYFGAPHG